MFDEEEKQTEELELDECKELHEPPATYTRNTEIPTFFGEPILKGSFNLLDSNQLSSDIPMKYYEHPHGEIWCGDLIAWLHSLKSASTDLIFADPPYNQ